MLRVDIAYANYMMPIIAALQWRDYEPDYDAYIAELESILTLMADVDAYEDWFVEFE